MPETTPSLGTLIRIGNKYLFSGGWWIVTFPGIALGHTLVTRNERESRRVPDLTVENWVAPR